MKYLSWNDIKKYNFKAPKCKLPRTDKVLNSYDELNKYFKKHNLNMEDWIYQKYLDNGRDLFKIEKNDYPYFLKYNIKHMILWINPKIRRSIYMNKEFIIRLIKKYYSYEFICFINDENNRSINGIPHYHIFLHIKNYKISSLADSLIL